MIEETPTNWRSEVHYPAYSIDIPTSLPETHLVRCTAPPPQKTFFRKTSWMKDSEESRPIVTLRFWLIFFRFFILVHSRKCEAAFWLVEENRIFMPLTICCLHNIPAIPWSFTPFIQYSAGLGSTPAPIAPWGQGHNGQPHCFIASR